MPAVLIHGVPDTYRVWNGVREHLTRPDVFALALPGFDSPVATGFTASKEDYVDWIIARLEEFGEPVDLVGHDWGCILTARVASLRPDLVRTWSGGSGPVSGDYEWHAWAKIWQTPEDGEQWMTELDAAEFARQLEAFEVPPAIASDTAAGMDATLKACILKLYRSAVHVGTEWEPELVQVSAPALVFWGADDPACPVAFADQLADAMQDASVLRLDAGHWTVLQRPAEIAHALEEHWEAARTPEGLGADPGAH